jgi:O-antigen/teichoic acid export membrane protein
MAIDVGSIDSTSRTKNVKNHVFISLLLKGIGISLSFFLVPITLGFLGKELYGIWIVMLSIMSWIALADIGIGNGLRNKLTQALSQNKKVEARQYISTAYIVLALIGLGLLLIWFSAVSFINWNAFFNSKTLTNGQFSLLLAIFFGTIITSFIFSLINPILNAFQISSVTNIGNILTSLFFLILLKLFSSTASGNLIMLTSFYCASLLLSNLLVSGYFFLKNRDYIPGFKFYNKAFLKDILSLGGNFFIIQIAVLLIFTADNFLIMQLLGPEQVSVYNIVFKMFSVFTVGYQIIMAPLWSAFTEAYIKNDILWISKILKWLNLSLIPLLALIGIVIAFYQPLLNVWLPVGKRITPPLFLVLALGLFVLISIWNNIYSYFLNGIGETKMQVRTAIIGAFINIPLAIILIKFFHAGLAGVVFSMCASLSLFAVAGPIKVFRILKLSFKKDADNGAPQNI